MSQLTARIVNFVGGHEKYVETWYLDPVGVPTIGYGFTWGSKIFADWWDRKHGRKMRRGDTISKADAHAVLLAIMDAEAWRPVENKMPTAPINVKEASASMAYNCGRGSLTWKWAAAFAAGAVQRGSALLRVTGTTAKGKRLPGLVRRRNEEADIAEFDRWPSWVSETITAPENHVDAVDVKQAQLWLNDLGYECGAADGIPGSRTVAAVRRFQTDHGTIKVDGIIGAATLAALQRAIDLKKKASVTVGAGGTAAGGGLVENTTGAGDAISPDAAGVGDWLLWGGLALTVVVLAYFAWRYSDELVAALKKL
jgi:GH24 family phage-related lysozyme (muramidase)